jgi:small-conductance mechanosensitive channel
MDLQNVIDIGLVGGSIVVWIACVIFEGKSNEVIHSIARTVRLGIVPAMLGVLALERYGDAEKVASAIKILQTVLAVLCLWVGATALKGIYYLQPERSDVRAKTPRLLVDIIRLGIVTVGGLLLAAQIWQKDLSPLLTTFGVGSLVLGLALQDTLGNLFSGLSLVSERPFSVGDWIQVGEISGKVLQVNWRAVRIQTRELDEVTVPNSALSKDRIINFSRPTSVSGLKVRIGFEYDAPPNRVRQMLADVANTTAGILLTPPVDVRVANFASHYIEYEVRFFISDLDSLPQIRSRYLAQVWYAARREGITIPYPIQTIFKTEIPNTVPKSTANSLTRLLSSIDLFATLSEIERQTLAESATIETYAIGEKVIEQGQIGEVLFVVLDGEAHVLAVSKEGGTVKIAALHRGDIFGEMSVLTGATRTATVRAETDLVVASITRDKLTALLRRNPEVEDAFTKYIAHRSQETKDALEKVDRYREQVEVKGDSDAIRSMIRRLFRI